MRHFLPWLLAFIGPAAVAQHSHINAGARSPTEGSQLFFSNGSRFEAASNFLIHLLPTNSAAYGPIYFGGGDVTFTSLPTFLENGGPSNFAALPGSHIEMVFETLDGPPGAELGVWDSFDGFFDATEITFTLATGARGGTHRMTLSENDASAGADPYGHIHGRKFSVSRPGFYTVGIRLIDTAANGANGGTLHAPSDLAYFQFQAGESVAGVGLTSEGTRVRFGTRSGVRYFVEATQQLGPQTVWETLAGPFEGDGLLQTTEPLKDLGPVTFFRLRIE
ncbi:MAG: hypothetical protein IT581_22680 [Verrucomicrobiales bacterium]|nr:hypothetical protein [Verrucomicrobiales bacterium]